jgi:hypothetical protein
MQATIPNSWGADLREYNTCHNPPGSRAGGRFCAAPKETSIDTVLAAGIGPPAKDADEALRRLNDVFDATVVDELRLTKQMRDIEDAAHAVWQKGDAIRRGFVPRAGASDSPKRAAIHAALDTAYKTLLNRVVAHKNALLMHKSRVEMAASHLVRIPEKDRGPAPTIQDDRGDLTHELLEERGFLYPAFLKIGFDMLPHYVSKDVLAGVATVRLDADAEVERGHARGVDVLGDRYIALPKDRPDVASVVLHEYGHHIERAVPGALRAATIFRDDMAVQVPSADGSSRMVLSAPVKLATIAPDAGYRDNEFAHRGRYYSPYVGKVYPPHMRATEVVSMGLQAMYDDPLGFAKKAPEHFRLTWNILRGKVPS